MLPVCLERRAPPGPRIVLSCRESDVGWQAYRCPDDRRLSLRARTVNGMSVSYAQQQLRTARTELERCRTKQAAEEKKAAGLDKEADAKNRSARSSTSASTASNYVKQAAKKHEDASTARNRAAGYAGDAAKAQKKVHDAENKLRDAEAFEAKKASDKQRTAEKRAATERERSEARREAQHRRDVDALRSRIADQGRLLAAAPWDTAPETISVLFVAASPEDQNPLRIDKEMREVQQRVRMADHRESLHFHYAVAAQPSDLLQRLNEVKPDIVHFSGHSGQAGLVMEDADGQTRIVSPDELATLLSVSSRRIRLAVFNSCESAEHAASAVQHIDAAIGMDQPINDDAAKAFAAQLYSAIAFGLPLQKAFEQAGLQVQLSLGAGSGEPRLYAATGLDADEIYLVHAPIGHHLG